MEVLFSPSNGTTNKFSIHSQKYIQPTKEITEINHSESGDLQICILFSFPIPASNFYQNQVRGFNLLLQKTEY